MAAGTPFVHGPYQPKLPPNRARHGMVTSDANNVWSPDWLGAA